MPSEQATASKLLQCVEHGQTLEMVRGRWDTVAAWPAGDVRAIDLTFCECCTGPAKVEGVHLMTLEEIELLRPLCSRCDGGNG